ncbi:DNA repair protein RecN [bacterium HR39]|nr:DNA repair protein RecN [bacterium HR39]
MLRTLSIRDIVLIDRLELSFEPGFIALTGETGAGKSILLDALGLALGERAERALVRTGAERGVVAAVFDPPPDHPARRLLAERGFEAGEEIVLRRELGAEGRSRAFVQEMPVAGGFLRELGSLLVEIHGQHAARGLLDPANHRRLLDAFAGAGELVREVGEAFRAWRETEAELADARERTEALRAQVEELEARIAELEALAPQEGEEERLEERRRRLSNREKLAALLREGLDLLAAAAERLAAAERRVERARGFAPDELAAAAAALERARIEAAEAESQLAAFARDLELDPDTLERIEERLFALREAARRHRVPVADLPRLLGESRQALAELRGGGSRLEELERRVRAARARFEELAEGLSRRRREAALRLAEAVEAELPPLRLERARLRVELEELPRERWGPEGAERVRFLVSTNPGSPFGPVERIASGGELSRFMLALEVVLARLDPVPTMIFDEVDAGIGGATAHAVGERLARLSRGRQVLVVTHAPQIAARADHHLRVVKEEREGAVRVRVEPLDAAARCEEIARMLAGAHVTDAARAAARTLLREAGRAVA